MGLKHRFRVDHQAYVYDAVTNQVLELSEDTYNILPRWERLRIKSLQNTHNNTDRPLKELWIASQQGLLSNKTPTLTNPITLTSFSEALTQNASTISLCLTESCNLRCEYCPYTQNTGSRRIHTSKSMPLQIVKKALTLFRKYMAKDETPLVSFYGGEPLLKYDLLKSSVDFAYTTFSPKPVDFNITTNGTIMNEEIARFLIQNKFSVFISLDGPQNIHDRYRKNRMNIGSYKKTMESISILRNLSPGFFNERVFINMVLAPPINIDSLNEYLTNYVPVSLEKCLVSLVDGSDTNFLQSHPYTSKDYVSFKALRHRAEKCFIANKWDNDPLSYILFKKSMVRIAFRKRSDISNNSFIPTGQCFPGGHKIFVDTKGYLHVCERIDEGCPIGHVETGINIDAVNKLLGPFYEDALQTCKDCYGLRLCGVCVERTVRNGKFNKLIKMEACIEARRQLDKNLISYMRIIRRNQTAFQRFTPLVPQKSFAEALNF